MPAVPARGRRRHRHDRDELRRPAYEAMVRKAAGRYPDPLDNEPAGQAGVPFDGIDALVAGMSERDAAYARAIVEQDLRIPQEIITRADL